MNPYKYTDEKGAHLHTLNSKPLIGTSSVLKDTLAKTLQWWAAEMAAVECLEAGDKIPTIREEYAVARVATDKKAAIDALQKKYPIFRAARFAHFNDSKKKAGTGTDMHAELENYVGLCIKNGGQPIPMNGTTREVDAFAGWSVENVEKFLWSEGHCFSETHWLGGISDCGALLKDGNLAIIDFKSSKDAFFDQFVQTGGYALEIEENGLFDADGNQTLKLDKPITALIIVPFGAEKVEPKILYAVNEYKQNFLSALGIYKSKSNYEAV